MDILHTNITTVNAVYFHDPDEEYGFLSNWYKSDFTVDGVKFSSAEQYIMYKKCLILGESVLASQILDIDDPAEQKRIARNTTNYSETLWGGRRQAVVMRGLYAKFSQNDELRQKLLDTGDAFLVECSWADRTWACGQDLSSREKAYMPRWRGKNILGFTLMEVRDMLK